MRNLDSTTVVPGLTYEEPPEHDVPTGGRRRLRRGRVLNGALVLALLVVVALIVLTIRGTEGEPTTAAQVVEVDMGDVSATVSANGNIASGSTVNVDFQGSGGVVTDILVQPGDKVREGQLLARVDRTAAQQALAQAQIQLESAQASYATTVQGQTPAERRLDETSLDQAQASVESARVSLRQARQSLELTRQQQNATVRRADNTLARARRTLEQVRSSYQADPTPENKSAVDAAQGEATAAQTQSATAKQSRDSALLQAQQQVASAEQQVKTANVGLASSQASVAVSRQGATSGVVAQAQAQVDSARIGIAEAQETLDQTDLRAPAAGRVAQVNGTVGEPSSSNGSSGTSTEVSTTTSAATTDATGFVVLTATDALQVTADVAEADIADVKVGQPAVVTLSASGTEIPGTVTAVDSIETITNNVVEYGVTVTLNESKGVRLGQSSQVVVTTGAKEGVLRVSSRALTTIGQRTTATVQQPDGTTSTVQVTTGLEGDGFTEVLDGLVQGETVVVPQQADFASGFTFPSGGLGGGGLP